MNLERFTIIGAVLVITLMFLVGCGGGSSGSTPTTVCRDSEGVEIDCQGGGVPPIPICVIFGGCL